MTLFVVLLFCIAICRFDGIAAENSPLIDKSYDDLLSKVQDQTSDDDLLRVCEEMFNADTNNAIDDIEVNLQGKTTATSKNDEAQANLLTVPDKVWNGPTVKLMLELFDNYREHVMMPEESSDRIDFSIITPRQMEENAYIDAILATGPMRSLMTYLVSKGLPEMNDKNKQAALLKKIWFVKHERLHYSHWCPCSCGFENIFMYEQNFDEIMGLHSWLYFAKREQNGTVNYLGYMDKLDLPGKGLILKQHSTVDAWKAPSVDVPEVNMFVGTSPELETALYTLCFMARPNGPCNLRYNNVPFTIQTKTVNAYWPREYNTTVIDTGYPVL